MSVMEPLGCYHGGSLYDLQVVQVGGSTGTTAPPAYLNSPSSRKYAQIGVMLLVLWLWQSFGENISHHFVSVAVIKLQGTIIDSVANVVILNVDVLGPCVKL